MKLIYFDDYRLGVVKGDAVVDVSAVVQDIPHSGPHNLISGLIERFADCRGRLEDAAARGQGVPLATIPESYEEAMKSLPEARKHADDLLIYDNTPNGRGHRLVARFIAGELVKISHTLPEWLKDVFGRELRNDARQQEKSARGR